MTIKAASLHSKHTLTHCGGVQNKNYKHGARVQKHHMQSMIWIDGKYRSQSVVRLNSDRQEAAKGDGSSLPSGREQSSSEEVFKVWLLEITWGMVG